MKDSEFLVEEAKIDEIVEESPDSIKKPGSSGVNIKRGSFDIEDRLTNVFGNIMINKGKSIEEKKEVID